MKILVTGHLGYIGSVMVPTLLATACSTIVAVITAKTLARRSGYALRQMAR